MEKLSQIEAIKLVLREDNSALHTTSNKRRWFRIRVRLMQPLETPTEGGIATLRAPPPNGESTTGTDTTRGTQENHSDNESDSYIDGEMQEAAAVKKSAMTAYLEQVLSNKFKVIQSMIERLPGAAPKSKEVLMIPTLTPPSWMRLP